MHDTERPSPVGRKVPQPRAARRVTCPDVGGMLTRTWEAVRRPDDQSPDAQATSGRGASGPFAVKPKVVEPSTGSSAL